MSKSYKYYKVFEDDLVQLGVYTSGTIPFVQLSRAKVNQPRLAYLKVFDPGQACGLSYELIYQSKNLCISKSAPNINTIPNITVISTIKMTSSQQSCRRVMSSCETFNHEFKPVRGARTQINSSQCITDAAIIKPVV